MVDESRQVPRGAASVERAAERTGVTSRPPAPRRVLLIDDDVDVRLVVDIALVRLGGLALTGTGSAAEARAALAADRPDAILLDVELPDASGPELAAELAAASAGAPVPIIILSGYPMDDEVATLARYGVVGAIQKPFDPMTLAKTVKELVGW